MTIERKINFFNLSEITIRYHETECKCIDSNFLPPAENKLTIRLTDGLIGVISAEVPGDQKSDVSIFAPNETFSDSLFPPEIHQYVHFLFPTDFYSKLMVLYPKIRNIFSFSNTEKINVVRGIGKDREKIIALSENILQCLMDDNCDDFNIISDIIQILLICSQLYNQQFIGDIDDSYTVHTRAAIMYIVEHYSEKISVNDIAVHVGCSITYLSKVFKKDTNKSLYAYLTEHRIIRSTFLLKEGLNVTETCYAVGFGDCSGFIHTFKKILGISPHKYKSTLSDVHNS